MQLLHGQVTVQDKKGRPYDETLYKDGFVIKNINKEEFILSKKRHNAIVEIVEFDYSTIPFKRHQTKYNTDGTVKHNEYSRFINGKYIGELTKEVMSTSLLDFKGIP